MNSLMSSLNVHTHRPTDATADVMIIVLTECVAGNLQIFKTSLDRGDSSNSLEVLGENPEKYYHAAPAWEPPADEEDEDEAKPPPPTSSRAPAPPPPLPPPAKKSLPCKPKGKGAPPAAAAGISSESQVHCSASRVARIAAINQA
jgi:hypothetical protein